MAGSLKGKGCWPHKKGFRVKIEGVGEVRIAAGAMSEAALFVLVDDLRCAVKRAVAANLVTGDAPVRERKPCGCKDKR